MNTIENIKKIALVFFIGIGLIHILGNLMAANHYLFPFSFTLSRILDIPFAMTALIYGLVEIRPSIAAERHKSINIILIAICFMVFAGLMYVSLFIPDRIIPNS